MGGYISPDGPIIAHPFALGLMLKIGKRSVARPYSRPVKGNVVKDRKIIEKQTTERKLILGTLCVLLVLFVNGLISYRATLRVIDNNQRVRETQTIISQVRNVLSLVKDAETGQRGYLITGRGPYLKPYNDSVSKVHSAIEDLKKLLAGRPEQLQRMGVLERVSMRKLAELDLSIRVRQAQGFEAAQRVILTDRGKAAMDQLRAAIAGIRAAEEKELQQRILETEQSQRQTTMTFIVANLFACGFLFLFGFVILRDMAARRRAEAEVYEQRELLKTTLASIGDGVITTDAAGRVTYLNPVAEELTAWPMSQAVGQSLEKVFHIINETTRHTVDNPALRAIREGIIVGLANHTILIGRDGSERPIDDSGAPIRAEDGHTVGAVLVFRDVTERKQIEDEREHMLAVEKEARSDAENASRTKDEFLAVVSHELRTPLQAMLGWTHLMRAGNLDVPSHNAALETIERNARAQSQLIEDILDVSRITTGKMRLDVRPVDLVSVINSALETIRPSANAKNITIGSKLDKNAGLVSGDPDRLQQIIWNLLTNSIKFTPKDGRIDIELQRHHSSVEVTVRDNGKGIDAEFLPHVFDQFRQDDGSSTRKYGGLGLGLSIVRHLVEIHGGTVVAESGGQGSGSTFRVLLPQRPIREEVHIPEPGQPVPAIPLPDQVVPLTGLKVLIVDDEQDTRELLAALLRQMQAEVRACASASEVYRQLDEWRADVLVSDIGMPDEDGYGLIANVRQRGKDRSGDIPAIALTAYARTEDRVKALTAGFQMHVPKPVESAELAIAIATVAGRNGGG